MRSPRRSTITQEVALAAASLLPLTGGYQEAELTLSAMAEKCEPFVALGKEQAVRAENF